LTCAYAEIDMASEDRAASNIARNYQALGELEKDRGYALREDYMVEQAYSNRLLTPVNLLSVVLFTSTDSREGSNYEGKTFKREI
jgi:hypothetical protein